MKKITCYGIDPGSLTKLALAAMAILIASAFLPVIASAQTCNGLTTPNLVLNPGFESGSGYTITDWSVAWNSTADPYSFISTGNPHSGSQSMYLGPVPGVNRLSQTIHTTASAVYTVCFWLYNPSNTTPNSFEAQWDNNVLLLMENNGGTTGSQGTTDYQYYSFEVAARGSDVLAFQSRNVPSFYQLDDVSVQLCSGCTLSNNVIPQKEKP